MTTCRQSACTAPSPAGILQLAAGRDIELHLARVKTAVKKVLQRDGVIDRLGEDRSYGNVYEAAADRIPEAAAPQAVSD